MELQFVIAAAAMLARTEHRNIVVASTTPGSLQLKKDLLNLIARDATGQVVVDGLNLDSSREACLPVKYWLMWFRPLMKICLRGSRR